MPFANRKGLTILEVVISLGIFMLLIGVIAMLQISIFQQNRLAESRSRIDQQSLIMLRSFTQELRTAQNAHDGSAAIASASSSEVSFYTDARGDGIVEKVRYFVENDVLKRGTIIPEGQPLTYNSGQEQVVMLLTDVIPASAYFYYYDESYDGTSVTTPLSEPIPLASVRMVEINLSQDTGIATQLPRVVKTQVMIRNRK